ncbi:uncharacterized protein M421DRAFT_277576 [Didymella exigua CBS 183.55]|uniref:Uncharacterized protein n=1 Tax=Didymella exigua CBS 183.55 TaxID=1150837 RepID=A0A6A5RAE7_9PLEO|nr:uncharacterized protein M421DRAFT_277576 [Didymella exigua CBS 183.55]KAF1924592.1 hypothetical protein M421DRAFT_277576 [Didymella exigua CBS 183.55]
MHIAKKRHDPHPSIFVPVRQANREALITEPSGVLWRVPQSHKALEICSAATPDPPPNRKQHRQDRFPEVRGPATEICLEPNNRYLSGARTNGGTHKGRYADSASHVSYLCSARGSTPLQADLHLHCPLVVSEPNHDASFARSKAAVPNYFQQRSNPASRLPQLPRPCSSCEPLRTHEDLRLRERSTE